MATPELREPVEEQTIDWPVWFKWEWKGELAGHQYFEVRIRRHPDRQAQYKAFEDPVKEREVLADFALLIDQHPGWIDWDDGRIEENDLLWWSVAVVNRNGDTNPPRTVLSESDFRSFKLGDVKSPNVCDCEEVDCWRCNMRPNTYRLRHCCGRCCN